MDEKLHSEIKASPYSNGNQAANELTVYMSSLFVECNFDPRKEKKVRENF